MSETLLVVGDSLKKAMSSSPEMLARMQTRRKKVSWNVDAIQQELCWRRWFPGSDGVNWAKDLDEADAELMFAGCVAFMEDNLYIKVPGRGRIPLVLRPAQKEVLFGWIKHRRTVSLKARQVGFSTLSAAFVLWLVFGYPDRMTVMLSRTERESIKLLAKVKYNHKNLPEWVRLRGPQVLDRTKQVMTFDNESVIESLPSANDPARGESVFMVIVDEWAFLPNPDEAWASIEPITDIGGRVIGISTANGEGNFFHNLWLGSQTGENGFHGIFHPWSAVTERDDEWYAQKKRMMPAWQIAQEYPTTPEEAFVGSGNPFFDLDVLRNFVTKLPIWVGTIEARGGRKSVQAYEAEIGPFHIWEHPNDEDRWTYVVGADIAMGELHGDYSVAYVMCVQTGRVVAAWHGHCDPDVFGEYVLPAIGWHYRYAVVNLEVNNHGLTTLKAIQRARYGRLYRRRTFAKRQDKALETMGWLTTATSKPLLADELSAYLRDQVQRDPSSIPHSRCVAELRAYRRDERGRLGGSPHDDCVMALGITVQTMKYAITERIDESQDDSKIPGSFAWWTKQLRGATPDGRVRLRPGT